MPSSTRGGGRSERSCTKKVVAADLGIHAEEGMLYYTLTIHFRSQDFPLLLGLNTLTGRLAPVTVRVQEHTGLSVRLAQIPPLHLDPEHAENFWEVLSNCLALELESAKLK